MFIASQRYNPGNASLYLRNEYDPQDRRPRCVWLDARDMFGRMVAGEHDLPEYLARDWLVVIDDLGAGRDKSEYFADALGRFANLRLHKWTVFTTNLTHREIRDQIGDRVASRMIRDDNRALRINARDYALRKVSAA
jgi:DNA replication protein DnaC